MTHLIQNQRKTKIFYEKTTTYIHIKYVKDILTFFSLMEALNRDRLKQGIRKGSSCSEKIEDFIC